MMRLLQFSLVLVGLGGVLTTLGAHGVTRLGLNEEAGKKLEPGLHLNWLWNSPVATPSTRIQLENAEPGRIEPRKQPTLALAASYVPLAKNGETPRPIPPTAKPLLQAPKPKAAPENASKSLAKRVQRLEAEALALEQRADKEAKELRKARIDFAATQDLDYQEALHKLELELREIKYAADLYAAIRLAEGDAFAQRHRADIHLDRQRILALRDQMQISALDQEGARAFTQLDAIRHFRISALSWKQLLPRDVRAFGGIDHWIEFFNSSPVPPVKHPAE